MPAGSACVLNNRIVVKRRLNNMIADFNMQSIIVE